MQKTTALPTYLFATVEKRQLQNILGELRHMDNIQWFAPVSGRFDIAVSVQGNDAESHYQAVKEIRAINGVVSTTTLIPFEGYVDGEKFSDKQALGQVFLRVNRPVQQVLETLRTVPGIQEALVTPGQWDLLVTVRGNSYEEILATSVQKISQLDGVRTSETVFAYRPTIRA